MTDKQQYNVQTLFSEDAIHVNCYTWFHNSYPELRGLLCYNLNNSRNNVDGARNKAKGLQPGRSDLVLYWQGRAIMIEFKTQTGTQEPAQVKWEALIRKHGFEYHLIRSLEEFQHLIRGILFAHLT